MEEGSGRRDRGREERREEVREERRRRTQRLDLPSRTLASSTSKSPSPSASYDLSLPVGGARGILANHTEV